MALLVIVMEATEVKVLPGVDTVPPAIITGPVKLPAVPRVNVLEPDFVKPEEPLIVPEPLMVKLLVLEFTVMAPGRTRPISRRPGSACSSSLTSAPPAPMAGENLWNSYTFPSPLQDYPLSQGINVVYADKTVNNLFE